VKCWYVYTKDDDPDNTDLAWAETVAQAKRNAYFSVDVDWTNLRAKRVSKLDGVPYPSDKAIHEAGFSIMCRQCHNDGVFDPIFNDEGDGFCDEVCRSRWRQKQQGAAR
jgi:hypothetical protein